MGMLGINLTVDTGPGQTKQSFRDEVDINKIIAGFEKTGMVNQLNAREPFYGDVSHLGSYQESLHVVMEAEALFMSLSANVRERFGNDPALMIKFLENPENRDEAIRMGLVSAPPEPPKPQEVRVVPDPVEEPEAPHKGRKGRKSGDESES